MLSVNIRDQFAAKASPKAVIFLFSLSFNTFSSTPSEETQRRRFLRPKVFTLRQRVWHQEGVLSAAKNSLLVVRLEYVIFYWFSTWIVFSSFKGMSAYDQGNIKKNLTKNGFDRYGNSHGTLTSGRATSNVILNFYFLYSDLSVHTIKNIFPWSLPKV